AQGFGLRVGQLPLSSLYGIEPGPVVYFAIVQIHWLLHRPNLDSGQAPVPPARNGGPPADSPGSRWNSLRSISRRRRGSRSRRRAPTGVPEWRDTSTARTSTRSSPANPAATGW